MQLTTLKINTIHHRGRYADGHGLYLIVNHKGSKSWVFRYQFKGKRRDMGLGGYPFISLKKARQLRDLQKVRVNEGIDPLKERDENRLQKLKLDDMTFEKVTYLCFEATKDTWKNPKHQQQWINTLRTYAFPFIKDIPIQDIQSNNVAKLLKPIWMNKAETARRVRQRIERVWNWSKTMKYCSGDNPAVLKGNLEFLLPKQPTMHQNHHKALAVRDLPHFWRSLIELEGISSLALQFLILTATRTSEVIKAQWNEFDLDQSIWIIPKERMKTGRLHRVPLSNLALEILKKIKARSISDRYVFSFNGKKPISNMSMLSLVYRKFSHFDITVHGFRSTFRDWGETSGSYTVRSLEYCLSHNFGNKVEKAYQRDDLLVFRSKIMTDWSAFIVNEDKLIPIYMSVKKKIKKSKKNKDLSISSMVYYK